MLGPEPESEQFSAPDLEKIAEKNQRVDVEKVRRAQVLLEELRQAGVSPRSYDISSPYERRPMPRDKQ